ncbi:MAG TPA: NAD(P)H-dependent oxidoreductase [Chitinophagaceae bacterium]|jgi:chromate reductase|nr:NAD(P)H-dependent oxidoreductase [Chitinophagaceae bacterium]
MYTIISATNRLGSNTLKVAKQYQTFFAEHQIDAKLLSLEDFKSFTRDDHYNKLENDFLIPASKFIFIMPEYNGSFPGIFKLMMDISDLSTCWNFKKVMLVGVANGRSGNLRGIDNMTNMCNYMKMNVYFHKLPLSSISKELSNDVFINENTIHEVKNQIKGFVNY